MLDVPWDLVHEEAELLEHVLSDGLAERIAAKLGNPEFDPHGDPIPSAELDVTERETRSLEDVDVGETVAFVRVSDSDPAMLRYLHERGIVPGVTLTLTERQPFGGPLTVRHSGGAARPRGPARVRDARRRVLTGLRRLDSVPDDVSITGATTFPVAAPPS